jgi:hypothetical protein
MILNLLRLPAGDNISAGNNSFAHGLPCHFHRDFFSWF